MKTCRLAAAYFEALPALRARARRRMMPRITARDGPSADHIADISLLYRISARAPPFLGGRIGADEPPTPPTAEFRRRSVAHAD